MDSKSDHDKLTFRNIIFNKKGKTATIQINRSDRRNALDTKTLKEIDSAIDKCENSDEINVIIISGVGGKSFASGADIKELNERETLEVLKPGIHATLNKIENSSKVTIAAIEGYALGGGCELALACDIRIATLDAKIGLPELNLSIIPGGGGTQRLSRIIGKGRALDMILTGKIIDGNEAERIGLVTYVAESKNLWDRVYEICDQLIIKGPIAVRLAKLVIHRGFDMDINNALILEKLAQTIAFSTNDRKEGTIAFLEKRKPDFNNK